jgi:hypothetical protein
MQVQRSSLGGIAGNTSTSKSGTECSRLGALWAAKNSRAQGIKAVPVVAFENECALHCNYIHRWLLDKMVDKIAYKRNKQLKYPAKLIIN